MSTAPITEPLDPRTLGWVEEPYADDFMDMVGPLWVRVQDGQKEYALLIEQKHLSRFMRAHGGMLMWLADKALAMKASDAAGQPTQLATIQLDVQFLATVPKNSLLESRCEVVRKTGSLLFMSGRLVCGELVVASASGVWKYK